MFMVVDRFPKTAHFVHCYKTNDATYVAESFFQEIVLLHGMPRTIMSDKDVKFISTFGRPQGEIRHQVVFYCMSPPNRWSNQSSKKTLSTLLRDIIKMNIKT